MFYIAHALDQIAHINLGHKFWIYIEKKIFSKSRRLKVPRNNVINRSYFDIKLSKFQVFRQKSTASLPAVAISSYLDSIQDLNTIRTPRIFNF